MIPPKFLSSVLFVVSVILFCGPEARVFAEGKTFRFRFEPQEGLSYLAALKKSTSFDRGAYGIEQEVRVSETKVTFQKKKNGYEIVFKPVSSGLFRDDIEVNNPILSLLSEFIISYDVDLEGKISAIYGYEQLAERMREKFSAKEYNKLSSVFNEEKFIQEEKKQWDRRVGNLVGRRVQIGDTWKGTDEYVIPGKGDVILLYTVTKVAREEQCDQRTCLLIQTTFRSDASDSRSILRKLGGDEAFEFEADDVEVTGEEIRLIDPVTMTIYSSVTTRKIKMMTEALSRRRVMTDIVEIEEYNIRFLM